ncbi:MAG: hypothetical protein IJE78_02250 [Bacteroidaceae bacterium]|nr:hypothetical protein [Bacteroidaceae bacterium]
MWLIGYDAVGLQSQLDEGVGHSNLLCRSSLHEPQP